MGTGKWGAKRPEAERPSFLTSHTLGGGEAECLTMPWGLGKKDAVLKLSPALTPLAHLRLQVALSAALGSLQTAGLNPPQPGPLLAQDCQRNTSEAHTTLTHIHADRHNIRTCAHILRPIFTHLCTQAHICPHAHIHIPHTWRGPLSLGSGKGVRLGLSYGLEPCLPPQDL